MTIYIHNKTGAIYTATQIKVLYNAEKIKYKNSPDYVNQTEPFPSIFKFKTDNFTLKSSRKIVYTNNPAFFRALVVDVRNSKIINKLAGNKEFINDSFDTILDTHPDAEWLDLVYESKNIGWLNFDKYFKGYKNVTC